MRDSLWVLEKPQVANTTMRQLGPLFRNIGTSLPCPICFLPPSLGRWSRRRFGTFWHLMARSGAKSGRIHGEALAPSIAQEERGRSRGVPEL